MYIFLLLLNLLYNRHSLNSILSFTYYRWKLNAAIQVTSTRLVIAVTRNNFFLEIPAVKSASFIEKITYQGEISANILLKLFHLI